MARACPVTPWLSKARGFSCSKRSEQATRERMHNRVFLSSLLGLYVICTIEIPALKRWAIITAVPQACQRGCSCALPPELAAAAHLQQNQHQSAGPTQRSHAVE